MFAVRHSILVMVPLAVGCGRGEAPNPSIAPVSPPPAAAPHTPALPSGALLPGYTVRGWVSGPPPDIRASRSRLHILDIWASWCPYCRQTAPGLERIRKKYAPRYVSFVSLTNMGHALAENYAKQFDPPIPTGYGLADESIDSLGARSGMAMSGYELAPVVYLVGSDGRIRWSDGQGRFRHHDPAEWERKLEAAIEKELSPP